MKKKWKFYAGLAVIVFSVVAFDNVWVNAVSSSQNVSSARAGNLLAKFNKPDKQDKKAPKISNVAVSGITQNLANITWNTNEGADSQVEFLNDVCPGGILCLFPGSVISGSRTSHIVSLSGLEPSTTYTFVVRSRDAAGNLAISKSFSFTTPAE